MEQILEKKITLNSLKMSNKLKEIDIKNRRYYFFDDMIDIKTFDPNNIKIYEKAFKNFFIYHIKYVRVKDLSYGTENSVKLLYLINI